MKAKMMREENLSSSKKDSFQGQNNFPKSEHLPFEGESFWIDSIQHPHTPQRYHSKTLEITGKKCANAEYHYQLKRQTSIHAWWFRHKSDTKISCFGSHSRFIENTNGENLTDLQMKNFLVVSFAFFEHRACDITGFQQERGDTTIYNQIEYIIMLQKRKESMRNVRSHNNGRFDLDDRLLTTTLLIKADFQRGEKGETKNSLSDGTIKKPSDRQKSLRQKTCQKTNNSIIINWKKTKGQSTEKSQSKTSADFIAEAKTTDWWTKLSLRTSEPLEVHEENFQKTPHEESTIPSFVEDHKVLPGLLL